MGIKWGNVQICVSALCNNIYLAKCSTKSPMIMNDRSGDRTKDCVLAVMTHMNRYAKEHNKNTATYKCDTGTLTWTRNKK